MQEQTKIEWMQQELADDEFGEVSENTLYEILGGSEDHDAALTDYVLELETDWTTANPL